jgi:hypothetical protein
MTLATAGSWAGTQTLATRACFQKVCTAPKRPLALVSSPPGQRLCRTMLDFINTTVLTWLPVYTRPVPKPTITAALHQRAPSVEPQLPQPELQHVEEPVAAQPSATPDPSATNPLYFSNQNAAPGLAHRTSVSAAQSRSISMTLNGDMPSEDEPIGSPVMHETLSVIDEHITDMSTPRHSIISKDMRGNDSGSEYSSHHRLSYVHGQETDEEEQSLHSAQEVTAWSPAQVADYLEDVGVEKKHCDIFKEQEINGEALLGMDQATIFLKEFELGPVGPRLRTWLKIKALQQEVKTMKEASKPTIAAFDGVQEARPEPVRNRATSMSAMLPRIPNLREGSASRPSTGQPLPRAHSTAGHSPAAAAMERALASASAVSSQSNTPTRPSAASVRSMNHNRRHSSIDYANSPPIPKSPPPTSAPAPHKKTPSFDRGWTMGSPQQPPSTQDVARPSSSNHVHSVSTGGTASKAAITPLSTAELDRGYFSGNEVDNRKARNVLRKKDSSGHSRNSSYNSEAGRRSTYNKRHSRLGSADSTTRTMSPISPAAKAYYGSSIKSKGSSSTFDFVRPLKPMNEMAPTVTKLTYADSPSIDAIASSPRPPASEASSQGRASPSPGFQSTLFGKKSRTSGLRAISDAITGSERATASAGDVTVSPIRESPIQSPTRTGSTTPSGTSVSQSFEIENSESNKRLTSGTTGSGGKRKPSKKHSTSAYLRGRETITPQEAMVGCDYSGWMKKKSSSLMTTWKTRLFVLRGRRLSYFYTENDTEEKGLIDISSHRVLPANNERITGLHATLTRAASSPSSPHNATIPTAASANGANAVGEDMSGMFIFKLVPPRAGLQKGVQFTKPIVHYFAVDSIQIGRLWMAALMKATIDRDDTLAITTTYQQKTISLDKARLMRQRPPALMDGEEDEEASSSKKSKESIMEDTIHEEDEKQGLAISGLDNTKALLDFAENGTTDEPPTPESSTLGLERKESNVSNGIAPMAFQPVG